MYHYQNKKLFLQSLHPAVVMAYTGVVIFLALAGNHPLCLLSLYPVLLLLTGLADGFSAYKNYALLMAVMVVMILLINPLFSQTGDTVLWTGPALPVLGRITFTLEAVLYGLNMGLRLVIIMTAFFLYNQLVNPDRAFSFIARFAPGSVMLVALTTRLIPYLAAQLKNIKEVQQTRGVKFDQPGLAGKIKGYYPLLKVLLLSSLENAFNVAEAIQSRAYGSGPRSYYTREKFKPRDIIILAASLAACGGGVALLAGGMANYQFYPRLGALVTAPEQVAIIASISLFLALPALLNWGWKYWPYLKWKI